MGAAYYNEWEAYPAQWLRNLSAAELINPGVVDERSIKDVAPEDVRGATQCHFFAGLGIWSHALRLAGVPDNFPVYTASLPCQPWSQAGQGKGFDDERHLLPDFLRLVAHCRPQCCFGEQSSSPDGLEWLDALQAGFKGLGYTVGFAVLTSASVGAPHIRHRTYWVAYSEEFRWPEGWNARARTRLDEAWEQFERCGDARGLADAVRARWPERRTESGNGSTAGGGSAVGLADADLPCIEGKPGPGSVLGAQAEVATGLEGSHRAQHGGAVGGLADADLQRLEGERLLVRERGPHEDLPEAPRRSEVGGMVDAAGLGRGQGGLHGEGDRVAPGARSTPEHCDAGSAHWMGDASSVRSGRNAGAVLGAEGSGELSDRAFDHQSVDAGPARGVGDTGRAGLPEQQRVGGVAAAASGGVEGQATLRAGSPTAGLWGDAVWLYCRDGTVRPVESRAQSMADGDSGGVEFVPPLAEGVEGRIGQIKAYGNAINALCAATFIRAFMESTQHLCG